MGIYMGKCFCYRHMDIMELAVEKFSDQQRPFCTPDELISYDMYIALFQ